MSEASLLSTLGSLQNVEEYRELHWEGSFEDYLNLVREDPRVARTAVVGVGEYGAQRPILIVEPLQGEWPRNARESEEFAREQKREAKCRSMSTQRTSR